MDIPPQNFVKAQMFFYGVQISYKPLGGSTKAAGIYLYLRIFPDSGFRVFLRSIEACVWLGTAAFTLGTIFMCTPIGYSWDKTIAGGQCISLKAFWYSHAAFHTLFDVIILLAPLWSIARLQMARNTKAFLVVVFSLGSFGCIASLIRMTCLKESSESHDPTWGSVTALMWTVIEATISMICVSLPPLASAIREKWFSNTTSSTRRDDPYKLQPRQPHQLRLGDFGSQEAIIPGGITRLDEYTVTSDRKEFA